MIPASEYPLAIATPREALVIAARHACLVALPSILLVIGVVYLASGTPFGQIAPMLGLMIAVLVTPMFGERYYSARRRQTQHDIREEHRRLYNKLALTYPEFETNGQRKVIQAAEALIEDVETRFPHADLSPKVVALRDALTWR